MLTRRDPWVNLLRVTSASFAAGLGGAASVTSLPFDAALGEPEELGRRMARNTELLLQEESNLGRVTDPMGGSWYVESLTDQIAEAAWVAFQGIEAAGGIATVLLDGSLSAEIEQVRNVRLGQVATRAQPITGVSEFPNLAEEPVVRAVRNSPVNKTPRGGTASTICEPLPRVRWAQEFEALRDASDVLVAATGARPKIFLVNLGPVAVHTARATFAKNFFEAGGIETVTSELGGSSGFEDPEVALAEAIESGAVLACLCSSDKFYEERAQSFAQVLSQGGLAAVYLAGNPGDRREQEVAAGVTDFVHLGVNALELLTGALHAAGATGTEVSR
jgi:methylmalonyl-CoA mutase